MDNEGHKSQQDVVGEVKKHPWEEKPEVVVPTSESERAEHAKINDLEKKKARRQKRQARKAKFFGFVKWHKVLSALIGVAIIAAIAGAIVGVVLLCQPKEKGVVVDWYNTGKYPDDMTIEKAPSPDYAFDFMHDTFMEEITKDIVPEGSGVVDTGKMEDLANEFIESLSSEYEKFFYRMYLPAVIGSFGDTERAKELMQLYYPFDKDTGLDEKQRFTYLMSMSVYWKILGNEEASKAFLDARYKEFPNEYHDKNMDGAKNE